MLPERKELTSYAPLAEPRTVRLCFVKLGALQYISHLDLQRTFARILARAELPLWYTQGFNPHPKLVFGLPLPVGCESVCEMADIRVERDMPCEEILARMKAATSAELDFTACYPAERKFADIVSAEYELRLECPGADDALCRAIETVLTTSPLMVLKHTKSGEKEVDIVPLIRSVAARAEADVLVLTAVVAAGATDNLSPEYLVTALRRRLNVLRGNEEYAILRRRVLDADGKDFR